jgi:hypothetical protein
VNVTFDGQAVVITPDENDSPEMVRIATEFMPDWLELFARKNSEYGPGSAGDLGPRGQFSDMYRKMIKLKRAMWEGEEDKLTTEGVDEILMDLVGHCFLAIEQRNPDTTTHPTYTAADMDRAADSARRAGQTEVRRQALEDALSEVTGLLDEMARAAKGREMADIEQGRFHALSAAESRLKIVRDSPAATPAPRKTRVEDGHAVRPDRTIAIGDPHVRCKNCGRPIVNSGEGTVWRHE